MSVKLFIKKYLLPEFLLKFFRPYYHGTLAWLAHFYYGRPSNKLVVIGITGTNGKSTTVNLTAKILEAAGYKVGYTSTVTLKISGREMLNDLKMTMPSGWLMHKWLKQMLKAGCRYAVLEISSEGLAQHRHFGINFDAAVFTNLTPEHLQAHGGFDNYKKAKGKLFNALHKHPITVEKKQINPKLQKTIITNADDENAGFYANFSASQYVSFGIKSSRAQVRAGEVGYSPAGVSFRLELILFQLRLLGQFDVYNALAAIAAAKSQNIALEICRQALEKISVVPGRMEVLQQQPFCVLVDYAYEPEEMRQLYETVSRWPHNRVLQVLGPTGGGRDRARISVLGKMAAEFADLVFITTDDPYDDDPQELIHAMAGGAAGAGKIIGQNLFRNPDRRGAIARALSLAQPGDLVLITGKGADQKMALADGRYIKWDDRKVAKEELAKIILTS